jgi:transcription termination factor Rho
MSDNTKEKAVRRSAASTKETQAPARKRTAAKKVAAKVATKVVTKKKVAAKTARKTAAKVVPPEAVAEAPAKPARKAVSRKTAAKAEAQVELPLDLPASSGPRSMPEPAAPSLEATNTEVVAPPTPPPAGEDQPRRFGRVPGGGPVTQRNLSPEPQEDGESRAQQPTESRAPHLQRRESNERQSPGQPNAPSQEGRREPAESRSKRRREKRKRRREQNTERQRGEGHDPQTSGGHEPGERRPIQLSGPRLEADGMLELAPKGFGFLRVPKKNFEQARDDVFVTPETIRRYHLRLGQWITGFHQEGPRGPQLVEITSINGMTPEEAAKLPHFDELKAINPNKRISFETTPERFTTRVVDLMAPVGRGQRGLIVSPPRSGKTTLLLHMAEAIREKYEETIHLIVLLVDERPEEVTEFRRSLPGAEIYASSNDENARSHCRIAELAIERAKRLVEAGKDVFLLMDSITRLARAYNGAMRNFGRGTGSGGITIGALEVPRRLFAAARNTRGGGSLTILATALIQTNSRADEAIFMEFKGTGNMELVLDRKIAENYVYPAVDIFKSGTRREELLLPEHMLHKIHLIRRGLSGHRPVEAMERLLYFLKKFPNNPQMLLEIKG